MLIFDRTKSKNQGLMRQCTFLALDRWLALSRALEHVRNECKLVTWSRSMYVTKHLYVVALTKRRRRTTDQKKEILPYTDRMPQENEGAGRTLSGSGVRIIRSSQGAFIC